MDEEDKRIVAGQIRIIGIIQHPNWFQREEGWKLPFKMVNIYEYDREYCPYTTIEQVGMILRDFGQEPDEFFRICPDTWIRKGLDPTEYLKKLREKEVEFSALAVLEEFTRDIDATGGVMRGSDGLSAPNAALDWPDLAATYYKACAVLGRDPKEEELEEEEDD
jgi:hypothetical protein